MRRAAVICLFFSALLLPSGAAPARLLRPASAKLIDCACYDLFRLRPDGTHRTLLSPGGSRDLADVSADRTRILFQHRVGVLETSTIGGASERTLAGSLGAPLGGARFSPDGATVAYTIAAPACGGAASVHLVGADGSGDRTVVPGCAGFGGLAWSPDSRRLAYVRVASPNCCEAPSQLVTVDLSTGAERTVARRRGSISHVTWSPAGDRIAYVDVGRSRPMLHVVRTDGSKDVAIAPGSAPTWSPSGRLLEYLWTPAHGKPPRIAVIARDGTHNHVLDPRAEDPYGQGVGWSPDGRRIVYRIGVKLAHGYTMALWSARPDGSHRRHLLTGVLNEELGPLYWTPDGRAIVYTRYIQFGE